MNDLIAKVRLLAKAEAILVRLHLQRAVRQLSLVLAASLFVLLALAMLNVALYLHLSARIDPAVSALVVAGLDLALAVAALVAAGRLDLAPEAAAAASIRDITAAELTADAERLQEQLDDLGRDIRRIRRAVSNIVQPGGFGLPAVFQWLLMLVGFLRRRHG